MFPKFGIATDQDHSEPFKDHGALGVLLCLNIKYHNDTEYWDRHALANWEDSDQGLGC